MTTAPTTPTAQLRGNACPTWCAGFHVPHRTDHHGNPAHPEDAGVEHGSATIDEWHVQATMTALQDEVTRVTVTEFRHDHHNDDELPLIQASAVNPGHLCSVGLYPSDARRLGEALILAADMVEDRIRAMRGEQSMNDYEADRIAAAIGVMRPDWPVPSVRTLIRERLQDRPRRDVAVALAWIASDSATKTPARVLESGPWWLAAAADLHDTREEGK
ncbi:MAG: hypothetical protein CMH83_13280 [Nocardioides sp.]|nr:hypothetical protein [Nocardioides sp.]